MFSFHKPRVYRSADGCCICRAKSSSSRFTDSRKYEEDSMKCFDLKYPRYGEICNACVLLVKRYKRLPSGSQRHWGHVVDARAGPGSKTFTKVKRSKEENSIEKSGSSSSDIQTGKSVLSEKFSKIFKKSKNKKQKIILREDLEKKKMSYKSPNKMQGQIVFLKRPNSVESDESGEHSPGPVAPPNIVQFQTQTRSSSFRSKCSVTSSRQQDALTKNASIIRKIKLGIKGSNRRKRLPPQKNRIRKDINVQFFDEAEWTPLRTCCGNIYECAKLSGAIIIDLDQFKQCQDHQRCRPSTEKTLNTKSDILASQNIAPNATSPVKITLPLKDRSPSTQPTPVLKKHHLFYKRQSESFPCGDIRDVETIDPITKSKIENDIEDNETLVSHTSEARPTSKIQINLCGSTLSKTLYSADTKSGNLLHKIKYDAGKIIKQSIEKINSAVRKAHDISDLKNLVTPVRKNFILSKTGVTSTRENIPSVATLKPPELSPTPSSSTKFSDNSSDSGFDENVQDRKSVNPLQNENETKLATRPSVQTLVLASGAHVHGQKQNLLYAGNDAAAKILQSRMQQKSSACHNMTILQHNKRLNVQPIAIDQSKLLPAKSHSNIVSIGQYNAGRVKVRPFYNSNIPLQHENGITTIVPASVLDSSKQSDLNLQLVPPNTISITPSSARQIRCTMKPTSTNFQYCNDYDINTHNRSNHSQLHLKTLGLNHKYVLLKTNCNPTFNPDTARNNQSTSHPN